MAVQSQSSAAFSITAWRNARGAETCFVPALTPISDDAREVLIAVNPRAGAGNRQAVLAEFVDELSRTGFAPREINEIEQLAQEAASLLSQGRLRAVVAAGGDGTLRLVAQRTPEGTPLVVLPLGTENLLARHLELSADARQLAEVVAAGWTCRFDAGEANGQLFSLMAGCGFDADVVRRLHETRRGHIQHLSYAKPILDAIRTYDYPELRVRYAPAESAEGDLTAEIAARWVFVVNLPGYAGGLSFAPGASGADGLFDVCTFKEGSLWYGLMYLGGVVFGQHESMHDFQRVKTRRLVIESAAGAPFQLDGDPGGELPVEIRVLPQRLTLLVSRKWAQQQGWTTPEAKEPAE
jgi:YegS/Rv2252/BmrU family lipid kinase